MSESTDVERGAENLADTETSAEFDLMEIEKRAKKADGQDTGFRECSCRICRK